MASMTSFISGTLIAPCKCTGNTKYAHEECLLKWFFKSSNKSCEVCLGTVNVTPVGYKPVQEVSYPILYKKNYLKDLTKISAFKCESP